MINRDKIIEKVLERRIVKKATIILALMNKDKFEKISGKYLLKKQKNIDSANEQNKSTILQQTNEE
jgi:hypothetical protein